LALSFFGVIYVTFICSCCDLPLVLTALMANEKRYEKKFTFC